MRRHKGIKKYVCQNKNCGKAYGHPASLKVNLFSHSVFPACTTLIGSDSFLLFNFFLHNFNVFVGFHLCRSICGDTMEFNPMCVNIVEGDLGKPLILLDTKRSNTKMTSQNTHVLILHVNRHFSKPQKNWGFTCSLPIQTLTLKTCKCTCKILVLKHSRLLLHLHPQ